MERRLVAILAADIVGYSHLMGNDEVGTLAALKTCETEMIEPTVKRHNGRIFKRMGDGYLVEFLSVVDCVECSFEWQDLAMSMNQPLQFRIGINLGDVLAEDDDIYGDGVNIAARLESIAKPGGVSISGTVYDQVKSKLPYKFLFTGEHQVKNIADPVRVYQADFVSRTSSKGSAIQVKKKKNLRTVLPLLFIIVGVLISAGFLYFKINVNESSSAYQNILSDIVNPRESRGASIAVLPFKNLSSDQEQEYFSDGLTNDIITDLSRFHELIVIASNTVFSYKGKPANIKEIGQQLNVQYILEGSVQKVGNHVRINAQLIESVDGTHIWAERYSQEYSDIFELQAEIVKSIVAALAINVNQSERNLAMRKPPQDLDAYDYLLQGWAHYYRRTRESNHIAKEMFTKATVIDPHYASAYTGLGFVEYVKVGDGWTEFPVRALESAFEYGQKALELDPDNASAHRLLANVYTFQNKYQLAIHEAEQAVELNPNDASAYRQMGWVFLWSGQLDDAITALKISLRLDNESISHTWLHLGTAYYLKRNYIQAVNILQKGMIKEPGYVGYHLLLAASYAQLDRIKEAESSAAKVLHLDPFFEVESFGTAYRDPTHRLSIVEGLRKAGL